MQSINVQNSIITLGDTDDSGKGKHFKSRFIQPGVAGYPGQFGNVLITKESLDKFIKTMVGVPVIINHKDITANNADDERVGVVNSVWYDNKDGWYWCDGIIWDEDAIDLIDKGWSVSCSYDVKTADDKGGSENNIKYDMEFLDGVFTHLALVNNPRYERANIVFNSKTQIVNGNPNQPRVPKGYPNGGQFCGNIGSKYSQYNDLEDDYKEFLEIEPEDYSYNTLEEALEDLNIDENNPRIIKTPIEEIKITTDSIKHIIDGGGNTHPPDKTRYKSINKMFKTLENPMFINENNGEKIYFKIFQDTLKSKKDMVIVKQDNEVFTNFPVERAGWFFKKLKEGKTIYDIKNKRRKSDNFIALVNNIIPPSDTNLNPNVTNRKQTFEEMFTDTFFQALAEVLLESYNE